MSKYDVLIKTQVGELIAVFNGPANVPTALMLQAVMTHRQLVPLLTLLKANEANTILITTPNRLNPPPGLTVVFHDGININAPLNPSPIPNVPAQFDGVTLTEGLAALVTFRVALPNEANIASQAFDQAEASDTDWEFEDTSY